MSPIRGLLLDVDGTLVDSNNAHAHAWIKALAESGRRVAFELVRPLIGMGGDKLLHRVCGVKADSPEGKLINERRGAIFLGEYVPQLRPCRGARELLELLAKRRVRMVVASSAKKGELEPLLEICGADRFISSATSSDDADHSKPDPDILQAAISDLGMPPDEVAMLGDTPYDVEAARRAGIRVITLRCGGWPDSDLKADAIYDDPANLCEQLDSLPFGEFGTGGDTT